MKKDDFENLIQGVKELKAYKKECKEFQMNSIKMCTIDNKYELKFEWNYSKDLAFRIVIPPQLDKGMYKGLVEQIQANLRNLINDNIPMGI